MLVKIVFVCSVAIGFMAPTRVFAEKPKSGDAPMPAAAAPDDKTSTSDDGKLHGRVPPHYSKLDLTSEQKQKIYKIQASYAAKMDALEKQLQDLKTQCNAEARTVLTTDQQTKLDELVGERKTAKSKDTKSEKKPSSGTESNKVTESAAK